jgi:hypothetical protein
MKINIGRFYPWVTEAAIPAYDTGACPEGVGVRKSALWMEPAHAGTDSSASLELGSGSEGGNSYHPSHRRFVIHWDDAQRALVG